MRKLIHTFASLLCIALIVACHDNSANSGASSSNSLDVAISTFTRTSLGNKDGDIYPTSWDDEDCIVVNGIESKAAVIYSEEPNRAKFTIDKSCTAPYNITYPYCEATTFETTLVSFAAEQSYAVDGPIVKGMPMCGYAESIKEKVTLKHLSAVLRFAIKADQSATVLQKIVIKSSDMKLAGDFVVDCKSGRLTPGENTSDEITYSLPDNYTLSNDKEHLFHIMLPAGSAGLFTVEFIETNGSDKMTAKWSTESLAAGRVYEFKSIVYKPGSSTSLAAMNVVEDDFVTEPTLPFGYVKDSNGNPIEGVAVSDGFNIVTTDENGRYEIEVSPNTWYIYITIPAEYEIPLENNGMPCFFKRYSKDTLQYDFTLTHLAGGKEKVFKLFTFGDPQVQTSTHLSRFRTESVKSIQTHVSEIIKTTPCYGVTLGDIIWNQDNKNAEEFREDLREGFSRWKLGLPVFHVMGNHDCNYYNENKPLFADKTSTSFELKAQRNHEDIFGPANYSFDRGDVHIIGMRNIVYTTNSSSESYQRGFLKSQVEWLKQDLALVPKDKMVVLCVHIPLYNRTENYIQDVLALLNTYKEAHVMSGHTHYIQSYEHKYVAGSHHLKVFEHNVGALCGAWWSCNMCTDGAPNGYGVFTADGNTFTDWYHIGVNKGMNTRDHQMRLYRGNAVSGGSKGYYTFGFGDDILVANVYFADPEWKVEVYENDVYSGDMELIPFNKRPSIDKMSGAGTLDDPYVSPTSTSTDMYYLGYYLGVLGKKDASSGANPSVHHLYKYKLKNKSAKIKVIATDRFGHTYTETKITDGTDYSLTK